MNIQTTITIDDVTYELDVDVDVEYERGDRHMPSGVVWFEVTSAVGYEVIDGEEREVTGEEAIAIAQQHMSVDEVADAYEDEQASWRYDAMEAEYDAMKDRDY